MRTLPGFGQRKRYGTKTGSKDVNYIAGFQDQRREPLAKECGRPLKGGQYEENSYPSEPAERNAAFSHLDFSSVKPLSDF